jgi:thiol-disulfide isomerase/thioredoxin
MLSNEPVRAVAAALFAAFVAGSPGAGAALAAPPPAAPVASAPVASAPVASAPVTALTLVPADAAAVLRAVRATGARAVVVNIWASWCAPCREEFPDILKVGRDLKARGAALVLVSGDFDDSRDEAMRFLAEHGVDFTTYLKTGTDEAFIDGLAKDWSGILPATMVFDATGKLRHLKEGKVTYQQLRDLVLDVIEKPGPEKETKR